MRKLACIKRIDSIEPIDGADAIELAVLGGWKTVVKKNEYKVGDLAVYCEVDSWIPTELAPFLTKGKEPREFEGVKGERLRTVKLRGALSQGLLLPIPENWIYVGDRNDATAIRSENGFINYGYTIAYKEGSDVTEKLGIKKWERPMNAQLAGMARGNFPSFIPKTDQERCQNMVKEINAAIDAGLKFEVTEKLEGSSMTCYLHQGVFGVCSRNLDLKETEGNTFWQVARSDRIEEKMRAVDENWDFAIQGELIGPGIQGNIYKLSKPEFRVFDVYNIQQGKYLDPANRRGLIERMGLKHVPVMHNEFSLLPVPELLAFADGKSVIGDINGPLREGYVFKETQGNMSLKAVSNLYLLGEK